ncbi:MAG: hypothetical protein HQL52_16710 [Magnetococcales bacterium]|nr:hypothetical protein [Magnetococcales bacterium]
MSEHLKKVTIDTFNKHINGVIDLFDGRNTHTLKVEEVVASRHEGAPGERQPFRLILVGKKDSHIPEGHYELDIKGSGKTADVHMTRFHMADHRTPHYQIIFN